MEHFESSHNPTFLEEKWNIVIWKLLADPSKARGCFTNTFVIHLLIYWMIQHYFAHSTKDILNTNNTSSSQKLHADAQAYADDKLANLSPPHSY